MHRIGKLNAALLCAALAAVPTVGHATTYYFCYVTNANGTELRYYSDILSTEGEIDERQTGFAYDDEIRPLWGRAYPGDVSSKSDCQSNDQLSIIRRDHAKLPESYTGSPQKIPFTHSPVPSTPVPDRGSGTALVIEKHDADPRVQAELAAKAKAAAERERETRRRMDDQAARDAANAAKNDALYAEALEKERRRRLACPSGMCQ